MGSSNIHDRDGKPDAQGMDAQNIAMDKDHILGFITESKHCFVVMNKALGCSVQEADGSKNDPKKQVAMSETSHLRQYLSTYGRQYCKKYANSHFSGPPGYIPKVDMVDELFSDEDEKA